MTFEEKTEQRRRRGIKCPNCDTGKFKRLIYFVNVKNSGKWKSIQCDPKLLYCPECDTVLKAYYYEVNPSTIGVRVD